MMIIKISILIIVASALTLGCNEKNNLPEPAFLWDFSENWPDKYIHEENQLNSDRIRLGRTLFYDTRLSRDSSLSCASCHILEHAFSDTVAISKGILGRQGFRNAPSLMNRVFVNNAHKDGGVKSIDLQAITPIEDHNEMDLALIEAVKRLSHDHHLNSLSQEAYGRPLDNYSLVFSLGNFVKSLVSKDSKYDQYLAGTITFNKEENRGLKVFDSNCATCHSTSWFGSNNFVNNGSKETYKSDLGRMRVTGDSLDLGKFRVASLRNIALTYPYMHDGSFKSLESVIEHYAQGGSKHWNQDPRIKAIQLSVKDQESLKAFLLTLTDRSISTNKAYQNIN